MRRFILIGIIIIILMVGGIFTHCGNSTSAAPTAPAATAVESSAPAAGNGEEPAANSGYRSLQISPKFVQQWNIRVANPESRELVEKVTLNGVVKDNKETSYIINTSVCGIVARITKDTGDTVRKGDILCVLNSPELLEIKTRYIKAFQDHRLKQENFERAKNLIKIKALEQKEYTARESEYKTAMAEFFSLEAQLDSVGYENKILQAVKTAVQQDDTEQIKTFLSPLYSILSPSSGKVMMRDLNLGERVESNKTIYEISDTRKLWVLLDAMEKDLQYIDKQKPVSIIADGYPQEPFPGFVLTLDEKIDPELRTVKVRVEVDNSGGRLKPGMFVKGSIEKSVKETHLAVPSAALVKLAGVDGVFAADGDTFFFKPLEVLQIDANGYAFVKGLNPEDKVVVEGAFYLKAEFAMQAGENGEGE
ncbi:MAG: efflux RND transporter periplasmic adaptor subunit [Candidatus Aminicenantes bacterium]|nr:efflux RND transporter periplasmic adaptor subunit [Candidatus Aminicenantes bacterium]